MQRVAGRLVFSASDINDWLACGHLTELNRRVALGEIAAPQSDGRVALLRRKGFEHEARYLAAIKQCHATVVELPQRIEERSVDALQRAENETLEAMRAGPDFIYQPTFFDGRFLGRADFLRRVADARHPEGFGYAVVDTKLARTTKASFLVQLCAYSDHVARLQGGLMPQRMFVALGSGEEVAFETGAFDAYFRHLRASFLEAVDALSAYPAECTHCSICDWFDTCDLVRRQDDHLGLVAWMRNDQIAKLEKHGIATLAALARAGSDDRPHGFNAQTFAGLSRQARLQLMQRESIASGALGTQRYHYELLAYEPLRGFALLPQPDAGDVYFDMEGDPYYAPDGGLEYLFGCYLASEDRYDAYWALSPEREQAAVSNFLAFVAERRHRHPGMHVYHYGSYEKTAIGHLTMRYRAFDDTFDDLLRAGVFVDLYTVVRQAMRISQESYSIKKLEPFYGFVRQAELKRGDDSIVLFEEWLDTRDDAILETIRHYNDEDCRSTLELHRWLLERRGELQAGAAGAIPWFAGERAKPPAPDRERETERAQALRDRILNGMAPPADLQALARWPDAERLRWYAANLVGYHRCEAKPAWWEYHHRHANVDALAEFDRDCIGDLTWLRDVEPISAGKDRLAYAFSFPEQQHRLEAGSDVDDPGTGNVTIVEIDERERRLRLRLTKQADPAQVRALVPRPFWVPRQGDALADVAESYERGTLERDHRAIVDLLLARTPRLRDRPQGATIQPDALDGAALAAVAAALDESYLFVQGPPGSGKSTIGGDAIARLLATGLRVGVLTRSHKAAHNLVAAVESAARTMGSTFDAAHKFSKEEDRYASPFGEGSFVANEKTNEAALHPRYRLVSGTPFLFARPEAIGAFDLLVADEAGQLALADVVACARSARSLVLLGDPLQLAQVSQGTHPVGIGRSVLEHLLGSQATVAPTRGLFLTHSWRMHPSICSFISETIYEGRLFAAQGNEVNAVVAPSTCAGSGLRWMPVEHRGNRRESPQEARAIVEAICSLLRGSYRLRGRPEAIMAPDQILVVSPYNAQRTLVRDALAAAGFGGVRVGTVDKFQGLQAPVVFYSMATSSGDDLPRDMAFLFEKNRFNVAISRAQCVSVLVCSPRLLDVRCRTPEQMALANVLCAYAERATRA